MCEIFRHKTVKKALLILTALVFSAMLIFSFFHFHDHSYVNHPVGFPVKKECSICNFIQLMSSTIFVAVVFVSVFVALVFQVLIVKLSLNPSNHYFYHFSQAPPKY